MRPELQLKPLPTQCRADFTASGSLWVLQLHNDAAFRRFCEKYGKNFCHGVHGKGISNQALIMKNLFKFYNRKDVPWVDLVWKAHYPNCTLPLAPVGYLDHFGGKTVCSLLINSRNLLLAMHTLVILFCFWGDKWSHELFHDKFPQLHSFAKNSSLTIQQARQHANEDLCELFHLPVSVIAANQGQELHDILAHMDDQENDMWTFSWEGDSALSVKSFWWKLGIEWNPDHQLYDMLIQTTKISGMSLALKKHLSLVAGVSGIRNGIIFDEVHRSLVHITFSLVTFT
ncbi:uncharacterized protein LOC112270120 [Brachypodium distachyon]|uniref:uncharacterized protein LOC112270120 n=1 Tax=Brachypodium distachyon TaxID=15368 RepID=UPI000D0CAFB2|nr:uncharacterized protein LOC112270120 [Brachypodium distachyon]|eukprot:XP_024313600.1 uncharacterized protein LOC112270120 [Brachypodium distachyon]